MVQDLRPARYTLMVVGERPEEAQKATNLRALEGVMGTGWSWYWWQNMLYFFTAAE